MTHALAGDRPQPHYNQIKGERWVELGRLGGAVAVRSHCLSDSPWVDLRREWLFTVIFCLTLKSSIWTHLLVFCPIYWCLLSLIWGFLVLQTRSVFYPQHLMVLPSRLSTHRFEEQDVDAPKTDVSQGQEPLRKDWSREFVSSRCFSSPPSCSSPRLTTSRQTWQARHLTR